MDIDNTTHRAAAIVGGALAATGSITLLVKDAWIIGPTVDHFLMPLLVALAVISMHFAGSAYQSRRPIAAGMFLIASLFVSCLVVYETTGRVAESRDVKALAASGNNELRAKTQHDLAEAEQMLSAQRKKLAAECSNGVGKNCKGIEYAVKTYEAAVTGYRNELKGEPEAPINVKAEQVAGYAALLGYDPRTVREAALRLEPLSKPLAFEMLAILLFCYGLGHRRTDTKAEPDQPTVSALTFTEVDGLTDDEIRTLRKLLVGLKRASNRQLAEEMGRSEAYTSKLVSRAVAAGIAERQKSGREVMISLARH